MNLTDIEIFLSYLIKTIGTFIYKVSNTIYTFIRNHGTQIESSIMYIINLLWNIINKIVDFIKSIFNKNSDNKKES